MTDSISRQTAKDGRISDDIKNAYYDGYDNGYNAGFEAGQRDLMLEKLPSAQPDLLDAKEKDNRKKTEGYICGDTGEACTDCVEKCIYKHSLAEECEAVPEGGKKMMDLIERQMAIDALGERPMVWTDDDEYALGERNQYDIDRLAIETVPSAQSEQQWIPCSERLPEKPNMYTVTDSKGDVVRFVFYDTESSREYWLRCAKAWMPLPEPYKAGNEEV